MAKKKGKKKDPMLQSIPTRSSMKKIEKHDCLENAVPYKSDGALGHGWECGVCGKFLQAG